MAVLVGLPWLRLLATSNDARLGRAAAARAAAAAVAARRQHLGRRIEAPPAVAQLKQVYAPQGSLPISGALVYLGGGSPIPEGVYCDRCVELPAGTPYTFSQPDGSFDLPAYFTGPQSLVVQKGQFRRMRSVDVVAGDQSVDKALTTMPRRTDTAAGDNVPKMAVVQGQWMRSDLPRQARSCGSGAGVLGGSDRAGQRGFS
jgi:hypothetical protein